MTGRAEGWRIAIVATMCKLVGSAKPQTVPALIRVRVKLLLRCGRVVGDEMGKGGFESRQTIAR